MMAKSILVGGPIQYAITNQKFSDPLRRLLEKIINTLEASNFSVLSAHRYEEYGKMDVSSLEYEVCKRDYIWMQQCDAYIAVLPSDSNKAPLRSDGTHVELGWASAMQKKILILNDSTVTYSHLLSGLSAVSEVSFIDIAAFQSNHELIMDWINSI